jgi:2-keto-4-pentenoate hydratase/2-oxohepta-3-ene-1,7-dioic acid hydratase in catechol pathway
MSDLAGGELAPERLARLKRLDLSDLPVVPESARLGPCVANVRNFIAVGLNFVDHAIESGLAAPEEPILFNKAPSCIIGPNDDVVIPDGSTKTDWEVELAVVVGASAYCLDAEAAAAKIAGFCICHDVSERAYQMERGGQWVKGKGCPTFGPLGPLLVTPDEIKNVQSLSMWLNVNGERMQTGNTSEMIFGVYDLVAYISQFMRLESGDVITTGTPAGIGMGRSPPRYLLPGDIVELGIEGLGSQRQIVRASPSGMDPA